jgi:hypothetical protein
MEVRRHIEVSGIVQGVGFRPYVYRLATSGQRRTQHPCHGIVLTASRPDSFVLPGVRLSSSLSQRRHVAATRRNAFEGQPESRCAVHVRLYRRHTTCDFAHCSLDRKTSCDKRTEATLASRSRRPPPPRIALHPDPCCGIADRGSDAGRRRERHIQRRFDSGYQRQNARDWPIQHGGGGACNDGRNRG